MMISDVSRDLVFSLNRLITRTMEFWEKEKNLGKSQMKNNEKIRPCDFH